MPFSVGSVLGRAFSITFSNFVPLVAVALVVYVPVVVLHLFAAPTPGTPVNLEDARALAKASPSLGEYLLQVLDFVAGQLVAGAIAYGVFQRLRGRELSVGESLSVGFRRLLPVIGVAIVMMVLLAVGFMLLLVPGLILLCVLYVAVPAAVVERPGVVGALQRSADLTRGHRWTVFGIVIVLMLLAFVFAMAVTGLLLAAETFVVATIVLVLLSMVIALVQAVATVVAYHDLRVMKEGVSTEEIAAVFD